MEDKSSRNKLKRPFFEDDESDKQPAQKRVRFPKGRKVKTGCEIADGAKAEAGPKDLNDPRLAAKERAKRRSQMTTELFNEEGEGFLNDVSAAEEAYDDDGNRVEDGVQIEAFNLNKEREEGYFDADGNFVEYVRENEIKDAWLDSIEANPKYTGGSARNDTNNDESSGNENEDAVDELSSKEIGIIERRIANVLESGETVLQALRRLKGNSNNRKEKMSSETKRIFDQLTEDADKLIQNDVYHEKKEVFEHEAEGYEKLARARGTGTSEGYSEDMFSDATDYTSGSSVFSESAAGPFKSNVAATETSAADYDMFADDEEHGAANASSYGSTLPSGPNSATRLSSDAPEMSSQNGALQNNYSNDGSDYVYDETSGYYYSSSLGYYYDPSTGLYCSAATGQWYKYNEETGGYEEVNETASNLN